MKVIFAFICSLFFFSIVSSQSAVQSTVLNSQTQSKQNKVLKQAAPAVEKAQENLSTKEDAIALKETEFDFGKIPQGKPVTHVFYFTNTGSKPLSLQNVQASCGCTTPEWSKDSVAAGAISKITVGYNAANMGTFTKTITITYNNTQVKQLTIKGEVWKTPVTSVPENSALSTLKTQQ